MDQLRLDPSSLFTLDRCATGTEMVVMLSRTHTARALTGGGCGPRRTLAGEALAGVCALISRDRAYNQEWVCVYTDLPALYRFFFWRS